MAEMPLRLTNVAIRGVVCALVEFVYLDAGGAELEDLSHTLTGDYDFDLEAAANLVKSGAVIDLATHAAFAHEVTVAVRFTVQQLDFADGTSWQPAGR